MRTKVTRPRLVSIDNALLVALLVTALALLNALVPTQRAIPSPAPSRAPGATAAPQLRAIRVDLGAETLVLGERELGPIVRIERGAFDALVASLAERLERPARDAELRAAGDSFAVIAGSDGVIVDRADLARQLVRAMYADGDARLVRPKTLLVPAGVSTERLASTALVAEFTTQFPRNPARAKNIALAARSLDAQLVRPGETFSFWSRLGEVSYEAGYVDAGAIIDGRSSSALAGGLCQVSTTLFNAVARAGYAIDERHAHSYYIERYPIGLDAAVFFPSEDFRWTNDTPDAVLIRASADDTSVSFRLYAVPSGRDVSFGTPSQRNLVLPAARQPADPAYPAGYVVRGRDVVATRTVTLDGAVLHADAWASHYAPVWGGPGPTLTVR